MRFFIITKKKLIIIGSCLLTGVVSLVMSLQGIGMFVRAASKGKKIPIYCVDRADKVVSISFDAAWGNEQTQTLLDILAEHDVKSTFFLVGGWVDKYPESVKAISDAGHDVGNHSDSHPHMPKLPKDKMIAQINDCNDKIEKITGKRPILFRPPYGDYNNDVIDVSEETHVHCIQWDVDSLDWKDPTPDEMVQRIKSKIKSGSIILMHNGAKNTPEALPKIIDMIIQEGYKIVPISEIIYKENYTTDHEGKQKSLEQQSTEQPTASSMKRIRRW